MIQDEQTIVDPRVEQVAQLGMREEPVGQVAGEEGTIIIIMRSKKVFIVVF